MSVIRRLIKEKKDLQKQCKEIEESLKHIYDRRKALEKQIQDRCKHSKYRVTESGHWDTLGNLAGSTYYKYCNQCGIKLDEKYVGG